MPDEKLLSVLPVRYALSPQAEAAFRVMNESRATSMLAYDMEQSSMFRIGMPNATRI